SMRLEASMVRSYRDGVIALNLAEAGVQQAIREILTQSALVGTPDDEPLTVYRTALDRLPRLPREAAPLGPGQFSYRITDEESRIDLNLSRPDRVDRLLTVLGMEKQVRDAVVESLQDWQDADEDHRLNGAESEDTYLKLPVPYRSRNGPLEDIRELLQIHGVTPEIYYGHDRTPPLRDFVTVHGSPQININTASATASPSPSRGRDGSGTPSPSSTPSSPPRHSAPSSKPAGSGRGRCASASRGASWS